MKQISARDGEAKIVSDDKSSAGGKLGTVVAYIVAALVSHCDRRAGMGGRSDLAGRPVSIEEHGGSVER